MAAISTSAVRVTSNPINVDLDLITADTIEDYYFVKDSGNNATALDAANFYRKSGAGSLLTIAQVGTAPSIFYESKNHRFSADDTQDGVINNIARAVTVAHFSATNPDGGYSVTAPADTGERKLVIYGAFYTGGADGMGFLVDIALNDGSGQTATIDLDAISGMVSGSDQYWRAEITYSADVDASTITASVKFNNSAGTANTVAVQVAGGYVTTEAAPTVFTVDTTVGTYSLTGSSATFDLIRELAANAGSYALSGVSAVTKRIVSLATTAGVFTGSYQAATTLYDRVVQTIAGNYAVLGANAKLDVIRELAAAVGSYTKSGIDASLITINKIAAAVGSYALSTFDAEVQAQRLMDIATGNYTYTGVSAEINRTFNGFVLSTTAGSYAISGTTTTLNHDIPPPTQESVYVQMRRKGRR